jgi:bifunctional DNA-binding transcriptional regulator/antitoxin component of YhaV-PrlF toxin-antitoxin module
MARAVTVEIDEKGRVYIPANVRREVKARRFTLTLEDGKILMEPVISPALVKGKYKGPLKVSMEELEEAQERFVTAGRR